MLLYGRWWIKAMLKDPGRGRRDGQRQVQKGATDRKECGGPWGLMKRLKPTERSADQTPGTSGRVTPICGPPHANATVFAWPQFLLLSAFPHAGSTLHQPHWHLDFTFPGHIVTMAGIQEKRCDHYLALRPVQYQSGYRNIIGGCVVWHS